jgi:formyltetrahydrofolate-dependent phosphoribosylglycinamide formyltransferase
MRVAVCISGRGSNLQALSEAFPPGREAEVVLVLSNRADAPGLEYARRRGIPAEALNHYEDAVEWLGFLERHQVEFIVLAGYLKLVPAAVVARFRGRIINIHPGLLPRFGGPGMYGRRVHEAVLASGATTSGATVHLVDEAYDRGEILAQQPVPVRPGDTPESLAARVLEVEHRLLPAVVRAAARAGHAVPLPQPLESTP